ncbi:MAG TPA: hypothetical protein VFZ22_14690 [Pyrinomonadaceae bacterium]|nr:hypothetical protein [Pyrinomonadaceae bacterium]
MTRRPGILSTFLARLLSESTIRILQFLLGAIAIVLVFWQLQFSTSAICCGDFDGYYHVKWTRTLWEGIRSGTFPPQFPWLPLTTLSPREFVDHHLLFHFMQMPFVAVADARLGAKVATIVFASLAVLSCYWLLMYYRIRYVLVWLVALLACSAPFLFRMNMAKAPPLAVVYLVIAIVLFFKKKYLPLLPLAAVFTWTYDLFVLLMMAAVFWVIVIAWTEHRFEWRPLVWVTLGCAIGLVVNPYFPQNFRQLYEHVSIKLTLSGFDTKVGGEWYPYDAWEFLGNSAVAFVSMVVGYVMFEPSERRRAHYPAFFLLFATALMIMTARWRRISEYWPPFAVMFAAFSLQPWLLGMRSYLTRLPAEVLDELRPFFDQQEAVRESNSDWREWLLTIGAAFVAIVLGVVLFFNIRSEIEEIGDSRPHDYFSAGAAWMRHNIPAGQTVFNTDWDDFPRLIYYDPTHNYISGLDPNYLFDKSQDLSRLYDRITLGTQEDPGPLIRDRFGARYVFSDNDHHDFFDQAQRSGWFDIVYEDTECTIMYIRDEKAGPLDNALGPPELDIP